MFVQLSYPWRGHTAGEVIEVGETDGRRLLKDGNARPAPEPEQVKRPRKARSTRAPKKAPTSPKTPADAGPEREVD